MNHRLTPADLIGHLLHATVLRARDTHWHHQVGIEPWRLMDLIHNSTRQVTAATSPHGRTWPSGQHLTGAEDALLELVLLLPARYGTSHANDRTLDFVQEALAGTGWTLTALTNWAAPLDSTHRHYPPWPASTAPSPL